MQCIEIGDKQVTASQDLQFLREQENMGVQENWERLVNLKSVPEPETGNGHGIPTTYSVAIRIFFAKHGRFPSLNEARNLADHDTPVPISGRYTGTAAGNFRNLCTA